MLKAHHSEVAVQQVPETPHVLKGFYCPLTSLSTKENSHLQADGIVDTGGQQQPEGL